MSDDEPRLIQWTGERIPPAGLLARLRAIHPQAELVDAGAEWWLGIVESTAKGAAYRRRSGARILARTQRDTTPDPGTVRLGQLLCQGFALVAKYPADAGAAGAMVEDFRRRCWQHDHEPEADGFYQELRAAVRGSDVETERARWGTLIRERVSALFRLWHRTPVIHVPEGLAAARPTQPER